MTAELGIHSERVRRVRELREARGRREQGRYTIEGPTLLAEARAAGLPIRELYCSEAARDRYGDLLDGAAVTVADRVLGRLSDLETPSGIVAVLDLPAYRLEAVLERPGPVLVLAGIADPGNAGTLIRSAEAFGAAGVIVGSGGADPFAPKVVRAAMGSTLRLPVVAADPVALDAAARSAGREVVVADLAGADLRTADLPPNALLAVGNERHGASGWLLRYDRAVRIPQAGAESLNAAVAGSILLYEYAARAPR